MDPSSSEKETKSVVRVRCFLRKTRFAKFSSSTVVSSDVRFAQITTTKEKNEHRQMVSSGREGVAMTRARKRKVGERDSFLWDVVVNNDDVFQTHPSEIESNGCEILVRGEYGDEKVD